MSSPESLPGTHRTRFGALRVAFGLGLTMMGTTLPTPLYPLYERTFALAPVLTPVVFSSYAAGVIVALLLLGPLSDVLGRRRLMLPALVASALSAIVFLLARGLAGLLVARVLSGLSAGIANGTATAWLVDLAGKAHERRATLVAVASNVGGLACGPLLAGLLAQYAPWPLHLSYGVDLALLLVGLVALGSAPETIAKEGAPVRLRRPDLGIPDEAKGIFWRATLAGGCAFAVSGVFSTVAPAFLGKDLHHPGPLPAGLLVALFFALGAAGQAMVGVLPKRVGLPLGCGVLALGLALLALALVVRSSTGLFVAGSVSGVGQGLVVGFGLAQLHERVGDARARVDSVYFALLYTAVAVPTIGIGFAVTKLGMVIAGVGFSALTGVGVLGSLAALVIGGSARDDAPPR